MAFGKKKKKLAEPVPEIQESENDNLQSLIIEEVKYRTKLSNKFLKRIAYSPPDNNIIQSIIPGTIGEVFIKKGSKVKEGDKLLELEAMKMLNTIFSDRKATILEVAVKQGDLVAKNQLLIRFKEELVTD
jgi:biotin carboxyl carrier protein